ncbi:hypothetical protein ACVJBD_006139 [Rhizobium mongolense]
MTGWIDRSGGQVQTMLFVLLFLVGGQQLNERGNRACRQTASFAHQGFVVDGPRKCLGEFGLGCTCRDDLGH